MGPTHTDESAARIARQLVDSNLDNSAVVDALRADLEMAFGEAEGLAESIAYGEATPETVIALEVTEAVIDFIEAIFDEFVPLAVDDGLTGGHDDVLAELEATLASI